MKIDTIVIPPWVSYRTYSTPSESKTLLTNEKKHETVFLENHSSTIWKLIEDGCRDISALSKKLKQTDLQIGEENLIDFITLLIKEDYLIDDLLNNDKKIYKKPPKVEKLENSPLLANMQEFMYWLKSNNFLYSIHWEITWRCNEKCLHCYNPGAAHYDNEKPDRKTDELSIKQITKILKDLKKIGVAKITFSGGDPFVRKDFIEILKIARSYGFIVDIYTNALLINDKLFNELLAIYPSCVGVSIYSSNPSSHDQITKIPGSYKKSIEILKKFNSFGVRTAMKSVQMKHTVHGWKDTQKLAEDLGAGAEIDFGLTAGTDGSKAP